MTTPKRGGDDGRPRKPTPKRTGPNRHLMPPVAKTKAAPAAAGKDPKVEKPWPSAAVAEAVKRGYKVIGENIEQGRTAAAQFRNGQYNVRDASYDLNELSLRMLGLARELSNTTIEVLERLLRDPKFPGAEPRDRKARKRAYPSPPPFRAAPPAPGGERRAGPAPVGPATPKVVFEGGAAQVIAATLQRPETPTVLAPPVLKPVSGSARPITEVSFAAGDGPGGLLIKVVLPPKQPAGVYSGVLCPEGSAVPLGVLTIEVAK